MPHEVFHSTFAQICATTLAIMLAFYGILGVNLAQQAQVFRQNIIQNLGNVDTEMKKFSYITEPLLSPWSNWSIPFDIEYNTYLILKKEKWQNSPTEILNPTVESILSNFTQAEEMDNEMRDWLQQRNITRFLTNYLDVNFNLHDLVQMIFQELPPPPAQIDRYHVICFVNQTFPDGESYFRDWEKRFDQYYSGISEIRSRLSETLAGISEAYLDDSKTTSQTLEILIKENTTDTFTIQTLQNIIQYDIAFASYYQSIFDALLGIHSQITSTIEDMEIYHRIYNLAFSEISIPVLVMVISGVGVPMTLLGMSGYIDSHRKTWEYKRGWRRHWHIIYLVVLIVMVILFVIGAYWTVNVLWRQISELYLS
jgi:hypothetical protein